MDFRDAFFDELNKLAQEAYEGPVQQMNYMYHPALEPPEPMELDRPKAPKALAAGKKFGMSALRIADKLTRAPETSYSRPPSVPHSIL